MEVHSHSLVLALVEAHPCLILVMVEVHHGLALAVESHPCLISTLEEVHLHLTFLESLCSIIIQALYTLFHHPVYRSHSDVDNL